MHSRRLDPQKGSHLFRLAIDVIIIAQLVDLAKWKEAVADLSAWTSLLDFLALAVSLWLGIYVVTRGPRSRVAWLAGFTLWSLSGYFLDTFLHLNPPPARALAWWMGWSIFFTAPLWLHLSTLLAGYKSWHRVAVWIAYTLSLVLLFVELATGTVFGALTGESFEYAVAQRPGVLYPLLCALLIVPPALAVGILYPRWQAGARLALRHQVGILIVATLFAIVGGAYLTLSVWMRLRVPLLWGHILLGAAVVLLGYGVARYNALGVGRASRIDFAYSALAISFVGFLYLLVSYLSNLAFGIPLGVFIFVLILVILSHSLYEWGSSALERLFYRRRYLELKANLRAFARETHEHDLPAQLGAVLETLCLSLECTSGWIALRQDQQFVSVAVHPAGYRVRLVDTPDLETDEINVAAGALVVPLYTQGEQIGVVVLGERHKGRAYTEEDLDLLDTLADQVAGVVYAVRRQEEAVDRIDTLVSEFRQREEMLRTELQAVLDAGERSPNVHLASDAMRLQVEDALRHLYDYAYLGEHDLAHWQVVEQRLDGTAPVTHLDRGRLLSELLIGVLEKLRPLGPQPQELTREWVQYVILHDAYVFGELNRDIMARLFISESSFNRARRRAVRGVARAIQELERAATQSS
jgi:GAF domain-containing protein